MEDFIGGRGKQDLSLGGETHDNAGAGPFQCTKIRFSTAAK